MPNTFTPHALPILFGTTFVAAKGSVVAKISDEPKYDDGKEHADNPIDAAIATINNVFSSFYFILSFVKLTSLETKSDAAEPLDVIGFACTEDVLGTQHPLNRHKVVYLIARTTRQSYTKVRL